MQDTIFSPALGILLGAVILFLAVRTIRKGPSAPPPASGGGSAPEDEAPSRPGLPPSGPMAE